MKFMLEIIQIQENADAIDVNGDLRLLAILTIDQRNGVGASKRATAIAFQLDAQRGVLHDAVGDEAVNPLAGGGGDINHKGYR